MSISTPPFCSAGSGGGPGLGSADGETPFGFIIPPGDPGALLAAGSACRSTALACAGQEDGFGTALSAGSSEWSGQAHSAFASYTSHARAITGTNVSAFQTAAGVLDQLAQELELTQKTTRQLATECETYTQEIAQAQSDHDAAAGEASALRRQAALAPHPQLPAQIARAEAAAAEAGATVARYQALLDDAESLGRQADSRYFAAADQLNAQLQNATASLQPLPPPARGAAAPLSVTAADVRDANAILKHHSLSAVRAALDGRTRLSALFGKLTPGAAAALLVAYQRAEQQAANASHGSGGLLGTLESWGSDAVNGLASFGGALWRPDPRPR